MKSLVEQLPVIVLLSLLTVHAMAQPLSSPGDMQQRHDLQLLNDAGLINIPLTAWPLSNGDIAVAISGIDSSVVDLALSAALERIREKLRDDMDTQRPIVDFQLAAAFEPRFIRTFENTPRDEGEVRTSLTWTGDWLAIHLAAESVANPFDSEEFRPDGSYVGVALGNWMVTAGWQERWWGPGRDGSLILSTNARPSPGIAIQRNVSEAFSQRWLRWVGPWTLTGFMTQLDDTRVVNDAWMFGIRSTFRPPKTGLEIGLSRAAQWCGDGRPCNLSTFGDLLVGNDNRGVNVSVPDEPGNQLGGFDIRWRLPGDIPVATYIQWIGEDGRGGGGAIGAWLRQFGVEHWGTLGSLNHRTHAEVADTTCREGGLGFSGDVPNCAYAHSIYQSGFRYRGRSIGHSTDGDSRSYSIGSTLVQSAGHSWNISLRYMEINRSGTPDLLHSLFPSVQEILDVQLSHQRSTEFGRFYFGIGFEDGDASESEVSGFVKWSSR